MAVRPQAEKRIRASVPSAADRARSKPAKGNGKKKGQIVGGPLIKVSKIRKAGEMAMIFDGVQMHDYNTNKISARHGKRKTQTRKRYRRQTTVSEFQRESQFQNAAPRAETLEQG